MICSIQCTFIDGWTNSDVIKFKPDMETEMEWNDMTNGNTNGSRSKNGKLCKELTDHMNRKFSFGPDNVMLFRF